MSKVITSGTMRSNFLIAISGSAAVPTTSIIASSFRIEERVSRTTAESSTTITRTLSLIALLLLLGLSRRYTSAFR